MKKYKRIIDRFSITITDINGSRHFHLSQVIKKITFYFVGFALFLFVGSFSFIYYLNHKVDELDTKRKTLSLTNEELQKSIDEQAQIYVGIEDKIATFEEQLGLKELDNNLTPAARMAVLSLTNEQQSDMLSQVPNGYPITNKGVSGNFGWRLHPILKRQEFHTGIDLVATEGTPVYATANAIVEFAGYNSNGYGYMVILIHNFGFKTVYAHLLRKDVLQVGNFVKKGELIGYSGNTGASTGPHLHYDVRFVNKTLEPSYFLNLNRKNMEKLFNQERRVPWQSLIKATTSPQVSKRPQ